MLFCMHQVKSKYFDKRKKIDPISHSLDPISHSLKAAMNTMQEG